MILGYDRAGIALRRGHTSGRGRIDAVIFAARTTGQFAHPRGRSGRHVEHDLLAGHQPLRQVMTQPFGVFDSPLPLWPRLRPCHQPSILGDRGVDTQRTQISVCDRIHRSCGVRTLVRINADDDHRERIPFLAAVMGIRGGQSDFQYLARTCGHASLQSRR